MRACGLTLIWFVLWVALSPALAQESAGAQNTGSAQPRTPDQADIRLVIDISGSMRRTDPDNLRRPALSLLVRLLPPDSRAGVWTFGQQVNELIPHARVDDAWRARAQDEVDAVNSVALYTNIGAALERAAYDRDRLDQNRPADIILLTDGVVDVSPDQEVNRREQARVINELVPELKASGYRVHTIALSDEADEALLREMAQASDGMFSRARNADELMDSLLRIFQQTVPAERLPIEEGEFLVDDSVEEFTALIRRDEDQSAAILTDPDGRSYHRELSAPNLNWHHTEHYDLVTIKGPEAGRWSLDTELQPRSRLTVVSNLQLVVEPLPNNVAVGQPLSLAFHLRDENGRLSDPELLSLLDIDVQLRSPSAEAPRALRWEHEPPDEGRYRMNLPAPRSPGEYQLELTVDGRTFERLFSHRLAVASQFSVQLNKQRAEGETVGETAEEVQWHLSVTARESVNIERTDVVAHLRHSGGFSSVEPMDSPEPGVWHKVITPEQQANYRIGLQASGETTGGVRFEEKLPTQYFSYPEPDDPQPAPFEDELSQLRSELDERELAAASAREGEQSEKPASEVRLERQPEPEASPPQPAEATKPEESVHPALLYASLILANSLLLVVAYVGYRVIMGGKVSDSVDEDEVEEAIDIPPMQQIESEPEVGLAGEPEPAPDKKAQAKNLESDEDEPLFPLSDDDESNTHDDDSPGKR